MKIGTIIGVVILFVCLACGVVAADAPKVNLDANATPFDEAMADIGKQAGVQIICDADLKKNLTGHFESMELDKLLDTLTKQNDLIWQKLYLPVPDKDKPLSADQIKARAAAVAAISGPIVVCDSSGKQKVFVEQESTAPTLDPDKLGLKLVYLISKRKADDGKNAASKLTALETERMQLLSKMTSEQRVSALQSEAKYVMDMDPSDRQQMVLDQFNAQRSLFQDPQYQQTMSATMQALRSQGLIPAFGGRGGGRGFGGAGGGN